MSKRDAAIYREAARLQAEEIRAYSCSTIDELCGIRAQNSGSHSPLAKKYAALFSPRGTMDEFAGAIYQLPNPNDFRTLALCLMAAICEAGDA